MGPILFLVYVNHVFSDLRCRLKLLADDLELYVSFNVSAVELGVREAQANIDRLVSASQS